jgi:hypothetical protein
VTSPNPEADHEISADPKIIQSVSSSVVSSKATVMTAIPMNTGLVGASRGSGIAVASNSPALAITTAFKTALRRVFNLAPEKMHQGDN